MKYDPAQLDALMGDKSMQTLLAFVAVMVGADAEHFSPSVTCSNRSVHIDCQGPLGRIEMTVHPGPSATGKLL